MKLKQYEKALDDLDSYSGYIKSENEDPVAFAKFKRLKAIVCIKMGDLKKAKAFLDY